jgi:hypothetical protein
MTRTDTYGQWLHSTGRNMWQNLYKMYYMFILRRSILLNAIQARNQLTAPGIIGDVENTFRRADLLCCGSRDRWFVPNRCSSPVHHAQQILRWYLAPFFLSANLQSMFQFAQRDVEHMAA